MLINRNAKYYLAQAATTLAAVVGLAGMANATPRCPVPQTEQQPSEVTRRIDTESMTFQIPANYRTEKLAPDYVQVYGPNEYKYVTCLRKNRIGTDNFYFITVKHFHNGASVGGHNWLQNQLRYAQLKDVKMDNRIPYALLLVDEMGPVSYEALWFYRNGRTPGDLIKVAGASDDEALLPIMTSIRATK